MFCQNCGVQSASEAKPDLRGPLYENAVSRDLSGASRLDSLEVASVNTDDWLDHSDSRGSCPIRSHDPCLDLRQSRIFCHTQGMVQKIAVTLDQRTVADLDRWVREGRYPNRSRALQSAVNLLSEREKRTRLARELAKIDPKEEMQLAEQGLGDQAWPEY